MGGMTSMRSLYVDTLLGEPPPNDILQEALPNVIAAHVVQSYVGGYGAMVHPVAACATAAVSVEEGVDKIRLGKAERRGRRRFRRPGHRGHRRLRRHVGHRRLGEHARQGHRATATSPGPTTAVAAGSSSRRAAAPSCWPAVTWPWRWACRCSVSWPTPQSFADGVHTSIPAPGLGALGAGRGGSESRLAKPNCASSA